MGFIVHQSEICPFCQITVRFVETGMGENVSVSWVQLKARKEEIILHTCQCPSCDRIVLYAESSVKLSGGDFSRSSILIWPRNRNRTPAPPEVPESMRNDYQEAGEVLDISAKASAGLSRRILQAVLKDPKGGDCPKDNLKAQIDVVQPNLPDYISEDIDVIRSTGNMSTHPWTSKITGDVIETYPGEAEWNLKILDSLFDHYYVKPVRSKQRKAELNAKLKAAGKTEIK